MEKEGQDDPRMQHGLRHGALGMVYSSSGGGDAKRGRKTDWEIKDCR